MLDTDEAVESTFGNHSLKVRAVVEREHERRVSLPPPGVTGTHHFLLVSFVLFADVHRFIVSPSRRCSQNSCIPPPQLSSLPQLVWAQVALTSSLALGPVGRTVDGGAYINMDKKGGGGGERATNDERARAHRAQYIFFSFFVTLFLTFFAPRPRNPPPEGFKKKNKRQRQKALSKRNEKRIILWVNE